MAREIKKPTSINEADVKEFAGDIVIDVTPREPVAQPEPTPAPQAVAPAAAAEAVSVAAAQAASPAPATPTMSFNTWFQKKVARNPRIKLSYKEAIQAHCKAVGLQSQATEQAYDAALAHFGL